VQDKVDHVHALAVGRAVGTKAVSRVGFVIDLQARGFVIVERAVQPQVLVGF